MFIDNESKSGKSDTTVSARRHAVRYFYEFMNSQGLTGLDNVNSEILSDYIRSRSSNSNNYLYNLLTGLKQYFRFWRGNEGAAINARPLNN
jgi:site-specific recombinase XerD